MLLTVFGLSFSMLHKWPCLCMEKCGPCWGFAAFTMLFVCCTFHDDGTEWLYEVYDDCGTEGLQKQH